MAEVIMAQEKLSKIGISSILAL